MTSRPSCFISYTHVNADFDTIAAFEEALVESSKGSIDIFLLRFFDDVVETRLSISMALISVAAVGYRPPDDPIVRRHEYDRQAGTSRVAEAGRQECDQAASTTPGLG